MSYTNLSGGITFNHFNQLSSLAIDLTSTGSSNRISLGAGSSFSGKFKAEFPSILVNGGTFADSLTLVKTGNITDQGSGNLICYGPVSFKSTHSSGTWQINYAGAACVYHDNVTYQRNGAGNLDFGYVGPHHFQKDLHITGTHAFGQTNNHFTFNGTGNQTISRGHSLSTTFVRLAVDKPSGDLIVDLPLSLSVNLNLQKGIVKTTSGNSFTASLGTSITGGSDSSYVEGPMLRYGTSAFTYPVGGGGVYAPVTLDAVASNCTFKVEYIPEDPDSLYSRTAKDTSIGFINRCGYWNIDRTFGTQNTTPTLGWDNNPCYSTSPVDASVAQWDGITWKDKGNTAYSGTSTAGNVKGNSAITSYPAVINLGGVCHFYSVGYIESLPDTLGDTLSIKVFPSSLKNYLFELNDSTLKDSSIDSLVFTNYQWNDTIAITATDYNNCKANSEVKVIKKRESTCGQDDGISFSSGQTYTSNSKTCSCNTNSNPITITSNIETSHDWQRIQGYDMRSTSLGGTNYNTPWKTIDFNIIVINDEDDDPTTGNFSEYHDLFFADALLIAQEQFSGGTDEQQLNNGDYPDGMIPPSDQILEPEEESSGARLIFNLNKIIHIEDNSLFNMVGVDLSNITSYLQAEDCNYQKRINIIVTEQRNTAIPIFAEAWGYASDPNCGSNGALRVVTTGSIQYTFTAENIFVPLATILNDNPDATVLEIQNLVRSANEFQAHRLGGHWAHEIGHNLDLYHTYGGDNSGLVPPSGFSPETNVISNFDFLDDVFDLNDENENSSFCNPPAGLICYHQPTAICEGWDNAYENDNEEACHIYATNNIMGNFNIRFGYISPLQVAKVQRALSLKSVRKYVVGSPFDSNPIEVTKNETWNMDIQLYNDIVVKSGVKLVIKCRVALPDQARIIVEPGAVLYLDGGTLTSFHEMWQGVRLLGDASTSQGTIPLNNNLPVPDDDGYPDITSSQGVVIINQGTIENAEEGIFVGAGFNGLEYDKTGGVVHAYKATFRNNFRDVAFNPYKFASKSKFIECEFITDDHLKNPAYYNESINTWAGTQGHVSLWDIDFVQFVDNTFINDQDYVIQGECPSDQTTKTFGRQNKGEGIGSYDSRFYVFSTDPSNPTTPKRNEFTGLTIGINSRHTFPNSAIHLRVNGAYFENNQYGIISETGRNATISGNTFKIPSGTGSSGNEVNYEPFGAFAYDYRGHTFTNNTFGSTETGGTIDNFGLLFLGNENIATTARILGNSFNNIENGLQFEVDAPAIYTNCNEFTDIAKEFNLFPENEQNDVVLDNEVPFTTNKYTFQDQGTGCLIGEYRVGNIFNDAGSHIWSRASDTWTYFYRNGEPLETPIFAYENDLDAFNGARQDCFNQSPPCTIGGGGDPTITEIHIVRHHLRQELNSVTTSINNWVLDDGNTSARLSEVADTTISNDTLVSKLRLHSPLSDTVLTQTYNSTRNFTSNQLFAIAEMNLPCKKAVKDSLISRLNSDRKYDGIVDTLLGLQVYNPSFITETGLIREKASLNSNWMLEIAKASEYYAEHDSLEALIPFYRDSLSGLGFERELISSAVGLDSLSLAKQVLDSLPLVTADDSLFADYSYLYFDMLEDSISWLQIDSAQLLVLEKISRTPSSMQSYAMAARALRGDTIYHRHPYIGAPSGSRIGSYTAHKPEKKAQEKSFEIFPNPNNGEFTLVFKGVIDGQYLIEIIDLTGRIIQSKTSTVVDNTSSERLQIHTVSNGVYFCRIVSINGETFGVKRIVISK